MSKPHRQTQPQTVALQMPSATARTSVSIAALHRQPQGVFSRRARLHSYSDILGALHATVERLELVRARMVASNPPDHDGLITVAQLAELRTLGTALMSVLMDDLDVGLGDRWAALMLPDDTADDGTAIGTDLAPTVPAGL